MIELEVDRLRQRVEEDLDIGAAGRAFRRRVFQHWRGRCDATPGIVGALLRPIDLPVLPIDREPDAPFCLVAAVGISTPRLDQRLEFRSVEIAAHDAHALAVAPVKLAAFLIENDLLRGVGGSNWNNDLAVLAVEIGALDGPVVQVGNAHIGPVDMTGLGIDDDAVGKVTARHDGLAVGTVRVHHVNFPGVYLENEEARDRCLRACGFDDVQGRFGHGFTFVVCSSEVRSISFRPDCDAAALRLIEWDCRRRDGLALLLVAHQESKLASAPEGARRRRPEARSRT